ncbi:gluconokinase [Chondromyces apiculatus]|uniref:Gluconokinase n=1 Tax=Chondromyces apiculatus DSM 436 TaxID=1192034 RepID=A0A017T3J2_9BACT|nr:gluconokinase [Chondromyces apiculatus]EYF03106.1 Gluconokinase [Chondromyces apiculatus DSM 436]
MVIIVLGVSGAGKTTVGRALAESMGVRFFDADDYHSPENVAKMRRGEPLTDEDRKPWLAELQTLIVQWLEEAADTVLACSALKDMYRECLVVDPARVKLVFLQVSIEVARARVAGRDGHFMPPGLVESQYEALEEPGDALTVDATLTPDVLVPQIRAALGR